ncbi:hypothetical protein KI387_018815, partial [Taxus chinensis]
KKRAMTIQSRGMPLSQKQASHQSYSKSIEVASNSKHSGESSKRKAMKLKASPRERTPKKYRVEEYSFASLQEEDLIMEIQEENIVAEAQVDEELM